MNPLKICVECQVAYDPLVMEGDRCAYCMLKHAFQLLYNAGGIGAGEAAVHAEFARQAVYLGKNPEWPRRLVTEVTG